MEKITPRYDPVSYFTKDLSPTHKQFLALRSFFVDKKSVGKIADEYGYAVTTMYAMIRDFKKTYLCFDEDPFFKQVSVGRKKLDREGEAAELIAELRKKNLSVPEIKTILDAKGMNITERTITAILTEKGFSRLPRRENTVRKEALSALKVTNPIEADKSKKIRLEDGMFSSQLAGLLLFLPIIKEYGIAEVIMTSDYPSTKTMSKISSILSFLALKLSNVERYSQDDVWCMDRGMGMFAGLNVLPKAAWFSSYSSSITRDANINFLKSLTPIWSSNGLLSDSVNLDFTAIPYWGDDDALENNWSGKYQRVIPSIQAVIAQDSDSGILCYGDTTIKHKNQNEVVLEFLDFYHSDPLTAKKLKYLIFDCKFTTYENLSRLNKDNVKFITIQRRSKNLEEKISQLPKERWKGIRIPKANGKNRTVTFAEDITLLKGYEGKLRQVFIQGKAKIKPAIIITNDFVLHVEDIVRKYARRWLVEKEIAEHIHFFHLNRNSSGIVVKVDFDLTMTILAHNLYRIMAKQFEGYGHCDALTIFDKFINNAGEIHISDETISVFLKRKRTLPLILESMANIGSKTYRWIGRKVLSFKAANFT
jgi:transposase